MKFVLSSPVSFLSEASLWQACEIDCGVAFPSSFALLGVLFAGALFCMMSLLSLPEPPAEFGVCAKATVLSSNAAARLTDDVIFMIRSCLLLLGCFEHHGAH